MMSVSGGWFFVVASEAITVGKTSVTLPGLGSYIAQWTEKGNYPHIVLGIAVMSLYVVCLNRFVWRRLYAISQTRYRLD
jgi:NitT/TauT family transport system permease protein